MNWVENKNLDFEGGVTWKNGMKRWKSGRNSWKNGHYVQLREELNEENPANVAEFPGRTAGG